MKVEALKPLHVKGIGRVEIGEVVDLDEKETKILIDKKIVRKAK